MNFNAVQSVIIEIGPIQNGIRKVGVVLDSVYYGPNSDTTSVGQVTL